MNLFKINYAGTGSNMGELLEYFYNMVRKELKIGESVNEGKVSVKKGEPVLYKGNGTKWVESEFIRWGNPGKTIHIEWNDEYTEVPVKDVKKVPGYKYTAPTKGNPNAIQIESINEAEQMHGEYLMQMLKAQADDLKKQGEHKTAAAMMYLWDRINQSARDKDIDAEYVHDFLNEPRGRKHSLNLPEWMILDLFVESFLMKEDAINEDILVWDELEEPFENLKDALNQVSKENTDPKWSKALLSIWNQIEKAETNLNNYDRKLGAITTQE